MSDDSDEGDHLTLVSHRPGESERPDELVARGNVYATTKGGRSAVMLEFIWRDGSSVAIDYGRMPIIWGYPPDLILIEYPGFFTIALRGKKLGELGRRLIDQKVTWIRECPNGMAGELPMAVTQIDLLRDYFPSRNAGTTGIPNGWTGKP